VEVEREVAAVEGGDEDATEEAAGATELADDEGGERHAAECRRMSVCSLPRVGRPQIGENKPWGST